MSIIPHRENNLKKDIAEINHELSNLLDFTQKEAKKFIKDFLERIEQ